MSVHPPPKRKEIYKYSAPWTLYSMNWSVRPDKRFRLAVGSFVEEYNNKVQIVQLDEDTSEFVVRSTFDHPYPTTKIMWIPDSKGIYPDLLATSGDYLRVWQQGADGDTRMACLLNNNKNSDFCAPLTSFDWNEVEPNLIGTSSIDTTCTIWGLETGQMLGRVNVVSGHVKTQLIAHDKEVFDIAFSRAGGGRDMFASVKPFGGVAATFPMKAVGEAMKVHSESISSAQDTRSILLLLISSEIFICFVLCLLFQQHPSLYLYKQFFCFPLDIWYLTKFFISITLNTANTVSVCTTVFVSTSLQDLISELDSFANIPHAHKHTLPLSPSATVVLPECDVASGLNCTSAHNFKNFRHSLLFYQRVRIMMH